MIKSNSLTVRLLMFAFILALLTGGSVYVRVSDSAQNVEEQPVRQVATPSNPATTIDRTPAARHAATPTPVSLRSTTADTMVATR